MDCEEFCVRLKSTREMRGMSQGDVANRSGLVQAAISQFESGKRTPSLVNLRRLADALDVSADFLIGRIDQIERGGSEDLELIQIAQKLTKRDLEALTVLARHMASQA